MEAAGVGRMVRVMVVQVGKVQLRRLQAFHKMVEGRPASDVGVVAHGIASRLTGHRRRVSAARRTYGQRGTEHSK